MDKIILYFLLREQLALLSYESDMFFPHRVELFFDILGLIDLVELFLLLLHDMVVKILQTVA